MDQKKNYIQNYRWPKDEITYKIYEMKKKTIYTKLSMTRGWNHTPKKKCIKWKK